MALPAADDSTGPNWPFEAPSGGCIAKANLEWVLTPGDWRP